MIVHISEMYDMKTTVGRIGIIGIHTPSGTAFAKRWKGLFDNHRFYRILGCNIRVACASALPADPLQIGTDADQIAPQDIMNPILYTAMTNEGWNVVIGRLYAKASVQNSGTDENSVRSLPDAFGTTLTQDEQEQLYYTLLSSDKWKKALPQSGFSMNHVRPFVHEVQATFGTQADYIPGLGDRVVASQKGAIPYSTAGVNIEAPQFIRGPAKPYPRLPCSNPGSVSGEGAINDLPGFEVFKPYKTFCACIVLPPARITAFYFRMIVDWAIEFIEPCSLLEKVDYNGLSYVSDGVYQRSYEFTQAKSLSEVTDNAVEDSSIDAMNLDADLVMEK